MPMLPANNSPRHQLNGACLRSGIELRYTSDHTGTNFNPLWTTTYYVNGVNYGQGRGGTKAVSAENAARQALEALRLQYP
ncbi:hypothetical protein BDQ17DRAFT_1376337, partial [Cyathus striatus]